jgi:hypothetical protein
MRGFRVFAANHRRQDSDKYSENLEHEDVGSLAALYSSEQSCEKHGSFLRRANG